MRLQAEDPYRTVKPYWRFDRKSGRFIKVTPPPLKAIKTKVYITKKKK